MKANCDILKIETMHSVGFPANLSDRNTMQMEVLAYAGCEFIFVLPVNQTK